MTVTTDHPMKMTAWEREALRLFLTIMFNGTLAQKEER
jgi:hypothetical protein